MLQRTIRRIPQFKFTGEYIMTKQANPFMDLNMFKAWGDFDPTKVVEQFTKMASDMKLPNVDVDAFVSNQRKSVEALSQANQKVLDGVRAVAERQSEIMREAVEKSTTAFEALGKIKTPQEAVEKQIELSRNAYDKAVKDMNELNTMITKAGTDAAAPVNARIKESFAEAKSMASATSK
jgi:phasin family protein